MFICMPAETVAVERLTFCGGGGEDELLDHIARISDEVDVDGHNLKFDQCPVLLEHSNRWSPIRAKMRNGNYARCWPKF